MYESLATQGRERVHTGLAGIDSARLKKLRNTNLRECFNLIDEMRHKLEFVAVYNAKGVFDLYMPYHKLYWHGLADG